MNRNALLRCCAAKRCNQAGNEPVKILMINIDVSRIVLRRDRYVRSSCCLCTLRKSYGRQKFDPQHRRLEGSQ